MWFISQDTKTHALIQNIKKYYLSSFICYNTEFTTVTIGLSIAHFVHTQLFIFQVHTAHSFTCPFCSHAWYHGHHLSISSTLKHGVIAMSNSRSISLHGFQLFSRLTTDGSQFAPASWSQRYISTYSLLANIFSLTAQVTNNTFLFHKSRSARATHAAPLTNRSQTGL